MGQAMKIPGILISWLIWVILASLPNHSLTLLHCCYLWGKNHQVTPLSHIHISWEHPIQGEPSFLELNTNPDPIRNYFNTFLLRHTIVSHGMCSPSFQWVDKSNFSARDVFMVVLGWRALIHLIGCKISGFKTIFFWWKAIIYLRVLLVAVYIQIEYRMTSVRFLKKCITFTLMIFVIILW